MITPSAPPVNEFFFYPGSPSASANKKSDSDGEDDSHSSSSSHTVSNISYHSELLAPVSSSNNNNTESSSSNSIDQFDNNNSSRTYLRHSTFTNHQRNEQYELTSPSPFPPPYQESDAEVPLLATQEDDVNSKQITEIAQSCITRHNQI